MRASPPKRVREISIKSVQARVVRPLFQAGMGSNKPATSGSKEESGT
jgi:hypothetical protein